MKITSHGQKKKNNELQDLKTILGREDFVSVEGGEIRTPKKVYHPWRIHFCWRGSGCRRWRYKRIHWSKAHNRTKGTSHKGKRNPEPRQIASRDFMLNSRKIYPLKLDRLNSWVKANSFKNMYFTLENKTWLPEVTGCSMKKSFSLSSW